ncbi:L,D-transpeptidase [Xanthobacter tagetidis]|uniref:L,D-transpeptidase n=1 Tax=Xanthobacter tagetidis TaxID=60216 RepID=A0A3L7AHU7_9HYPH|nr:L,D-transpeptidase [Xanthobacter tagetidis]MBB6306862.1 lipoprotein-anchoring transpeptidase ErfK/SrfK [Xanthobacter tagetidis]RLP80066.1 L,D-transpeptidase [Xanthobacter tagetidis]
MASDDPITSSRLSRRLFMLGAPLALAACQTTQPSARGPVYSSHLVSMYGPVEGEPHPVDAVDLDEVDPQFLRQEVDYSGGYAPGTIVVDIDKRYLYLVERGGRAIRYGVGVGKQGYSFKGWATIRRKEKWPGWTPTTNMIRLQPERYGPYAGGLPGGEDNPLGPRALYLYDGDRDTMFRIHGTIEPWSIGKQVSSGCIRLLNQDIIDLYERVPLGTRVMVVGSGSAGA